MPSRPSGTTTLLFTDIEGSTTLLQHLGDSRYADVLAEHHRLLRTAVEEHGGHEADTKGDGLLLVFPSARAAVAAAVAAQRAVMTYPWPAGVEVRVRMGIHTGEPLESPEGYVGLDVHRAARICDAGHGGQILLSSSTHALVADALPPGLRVRHLGQHRLKDLAQPENIFQLLAADLRADFPSLKSLEAFANNLPRQLTTFIGRRREIAEVKRLFSATRLVTLTGTGGAGKTRLALQVAAEVAAEYADGAWFVELAALFDPMLVPQAVASSLGVREIPGRPLLAGLLEELQSKELLLVLDNCEHLVEACAHLAVAMLQACPGLRVLATSREALSAPGETVWRVPSLSLPDLSQVPVAEELILYEAVQLFVERATAIRPSFVPTPENARAVSDLCRRLDGIPLAIELAAARVSVMSVAQIAKRLDDRFRLLTGRSRTVLPRHQTLKAAVDWSYHLLSEEEKAVWRRLSVFAGGWTLEAGEVIAEGGEVGAGDVLDLLTQLVSKSLVLMDEQCGRARYRFLETLAQYGRDRLLESGEADAVRDRHLAWFLRLAEQAEPELVGAQQAAWLALLEAEHDNLRAAMEWSLNGGEPEAGLRLASAVWRFWFIHGYLSEGRRWLEMLLKRNDGASTAVRANALLAAGNLAVFGQSDFAAGRSYYEESLVLWREAGDDRGVARLLNGLGMLAAGQGDHAAARTLYAEALCIRRRLGDEWGVANSLHNLGRVVFRQGDYATANTMLKESLSIWRELGDKQNIAMALVNMGFIACSQDDYPSAKAYVAESLAIRQELGDKRGIAYALEGFAWLAAAQGHGARAARLFGAADALRDALGAPLPPADRPNYDRLIGAARSAIGEDQFSAAWSEGRAMTLEQAVREAERNEAVGPETYGMPSSTRGLE
jgi:predicted ATPase/class 3 adenylate cyclase